MRTSSILRLASAAVLLCSMSSFGCEKENVGPNGGCQKKTTTPTTTTPPVGAS
ncbi:MAG: hypothetical protein JWR44_3652 [Hymenobacter sp.]|jgi:hypothetical protein|nr:hypothetical protein [Hymenobacter sp.]